MGKNAAVKRTLSVGLFAVAIAVGCKQEHAHLPQVAPIPVEQLLANAPRYAHQVVKVRGCYVSGFERSVLEPCDSQKHDRLVRIESAEEIYETAKIMKYSVPEPEALQSPPKTTFVFQYDAAKSRIAWQKLRSASFRRLEVILVGQFDANAIGTAVDLTGADGRLILIETLDAKPL